ncbi:WD40 repeat-like protein [Auriculariales sp. MPI-PUGE-AT-0066]|nr:WD40 repeat-like protein [Auriculariales sp. MPI-PUGE-AT-0066]
MRPDISRRKQTLLILLDALRELQDEDLSSTPVTTSRNVPDSAAGPRDDERKHLEGARSLAAFELHVHDLDRELRNFSNAISQLGSSVGLLSASFHIRRRLSRILYLVHHNATALFPRNVRAKPSTVVLPLGSYAGELNMECFPGEIEGLAKDFKNFVQSLTEFPEFCDETVDATIIAFAGDLEYRASCLRDFCGQFGLPGVSRYVHELSAEIGEGLTKVSAAVVVFVEIGVPTIRFSRQDRASSVLYLATMATFLSAVTATTIQFSYSKTDQVIDAWVNVLWVSSLVFSISSAVNSLLGLIWRQAAYRSPSHRIPCVGLALFTYSSHQSRAVSSIVTALTGCSLFGLIAVSSWFMAERLIYSKHHGQRWLADVLDNYNIEIKRVLGIDWAMHTLRSHTRHVLSMGRQCLAGLRWLAKLLCRMPARNAAEPPPQISRGDGIPGSDHMPSSTFCDCDTDLEAQSPISTIKDPLVSFAASDQWPRAPVSYNAPVEAQFEGSTAVPRNQRFKNAVRSVMTLHSALNGAAATTTRHTILDTTGDRRQSTAGGIFPASLTAAGKVLRITSARANLTRVKVTRIMPAHDALVRNLAFSPDGQLLATCSWDRASALLKASDLSPHRDLTHPHDFVGQVMWSPNGSLLLTKLTSGINIWTADGVYEGWLQTVRAKTEKRIVVYDRLKKEIVHQVPVLDDVRHITLSEDDEFALIGYENKASTVFSQAPPQLWRISLFKNHTRLGLVHTYLPTQDMDFAGPSYFAGKNDQMVLCASKCGDIHVWDRESAALLHHFPPYLSDGDVTCIAWNNAAEQYMFATGSHDGTVRLWTTGHDGG